jgi:hypothetical protein
MHVKVTISGSRQYVQLVESYRDDSGRVKKRTVATLGRLDQLGGDLDSVIRGLMKITGQDPASLDSSETTFESAKAYGDLWVLTQLWNTLGFCEIRKVFRAARFTTDVEACVRAMAFNRLCDPDSKLGVLRWLETVPCRAFLSMDSRISNFSEAWMHWLSIKRLLIRSRPLCFVL